MSLLETLAYLGDEANSLTDQQLGIFHACAEVIDRRYPDGGREHRLALEGAMSIIRDEVELEAFSDGWKTARKLERLQMAGLTGAIIAAVTAGESELAVSELTGLNRATVRRALGK